MPSENFYNLGCNYHVNDKRWNLEGSSKSLVEKAGQGKQLQENNSSHA